MKKVKVTLVKSKIGHPETQKRTLVALGLGRMNSSKEHTVTPQIEGMIAKVAHLLKVEEI
ncbi:MAG: 50S ribosomal protein L30 [Bacteroidales bacterium]|nr:50S ribosomal protein L30 [Bacteroidales bacterium]